MSTQVRVGISGWTYAPWRKIFYPDGLRQADELRYASRQFSSIEINGSFYSLQRPSSYQAWFQQTPEDFVFAVKGGRFITHMKRLRDVKTALANFFASGVLCLGQKLGPFLWQLPPNLAFSPDVLRAFFDLLPKTTRELERLARFHDTRLAGRVALEAPASAPVRHALEVRHPSFLDGHYVDLLREHGIASCVADTAGLYPLIDEPTADFAYARLHGSKRLYVSGYSRRELSAWAERARSWRPRDAFVYFDNDVKVRAPFDAQNLALLLAGERTLRPPPSIRDVTEEPRTTWPAWTKAPRSA